MLYTSIAIVSAALWADQHRRKAQQQAQLLSMVQALSSTVQTMKDQMVELGWQSDDDEEEEEEEEEEEDE